MIDYMCSVARRLFSGVGGLNGGVAAVTMSLYSARWSGDPMQWLAYQSIFIIREKQHRHDDSIEDRKRNCYSLVY